MLLKPEALRVLSFPAPMPFAPVRICRLVSDMIQNPDIKMAIANIPQRFHAPDETPSDLIATTEAYNTDLPKLLEALSTAESPLYVVELAQHYKCELHIPSHRLVFLPRSLSPS
jgi:hypothetical protein